MDDTTLILVRGEGMGHAERTLSLNLFVNHLRLLLENGTLPGAICFYTEGVKLVTQDSPALDLLRALEDRGVRLIICATCLNFLGIVDQVRVGIVGGMGDIIAAQAKAAKVIRL